MLRRHHRENLKSYNTAYAYPPWWTKEKYTYFSS
jgi:hypothetical protein